MNSEQVSSEARPAKWHTAASIILVLIIILGGLIAWRTNKKPSQEIIRIGIVGHFSGKYANYGIPMRKAVELAIDELNEGDNIQKKHFELISEDDNSDSSSAVTAINKLATVDNVDYIISAEASAVTPAVTPIAQNNKKILMITLASAPGLTKVGDYIFRSMAPDDYQATKIVDYINNNLNSKKVAGLYTNNAYGIGIKNIINENKAVENVASEMFESDSTDFRTQLMKIKDSNADTLVIVATNEYPVILRQVKELGLNVKIITSETFKDDNLLKDSGNYAEGVSVAFMSNPRDSVHFNDNYLAKFDEKPSAYGSYAYDGMIALAKAIKETSDKEAMKDTLNKMNFDGASGKVSFSRNRDRIGSEYSIYTVNSGQFVEIK